MPGTTRVAAGGRVRAHRAVLAVALVVLALALGIGLALALPTAPPAPLPVPAPPATSVGGAVPAPADDGCPHSRPGHLC